MLGSGEDCGTLELSMPPRYSAPANYCRVRTWVVFLDLLNFMWKLLIFKY